MTARAPSRSQPNAPATDDSNTRRMNPHLLKSDPVFTSFRTLPCSHHGVDRPAHHELSGHAESVPDSNPRFKAIPAVIMSFDTATNRQSIEKRTATRRDAPQCTPNPLPQKFPFGKVANFTQRTPPGRPRGLFEQVKSLFRGCWVLPRRLWGQKFEIRNSLQKFCAEICI